MTTLLQWSKYTGHSLTFVTVFYGDGSLRGFVVSNVAQSFTFPCGLILDDHAIFNITVLLIQSDRGNGQKLQDLYSF